MIPNMDNATGVRYTLYRADDIEAELLDDLLFLYGRDISYSDALAAHLEEALLAHEEAAEELRITRAETGEDRENPNVGEDDPDFDEDAVTQAFADSYECDEPIHGGTYQGISYRTTWLGGALHLWILESPIIGHFRLCSPCAPGACDGGSRANLAEGYAGYDVLPTWLFIEPDAPRSFADRLNQFE